MSYYKPIESSNPGFFRLSQTLATSYVPKYNPLPNAVHADRKAAPLKSPLTPLSRITSRVTSIAPRFFFPSLSPSPAVTIILVLTTSLGVVIHAANAPAPAALPPLISPVSSSVEGFPPGLDSPSFARRCSNAGNWRAVKGRLRATRAVYPVKSRREAPVEVRWRKACSDVLVVPLVRSIWAFCLTSSAGARTRQDAISATAEAEEWIKG